MCEIGHQAARRSHTDLVLKAASSRVNVDFVDA